MKCTCYIPPNPVPCRPPSLRAAASPHALPTLSDDIPTEIFLTFMKRTLYIPFPLRATCLPLRTLYPFPLLCALHPFPLRSTCLLLLCALHSSAACYVPSPVHLSEPDSLLTPSLHHSLTHASHSLPPLPPRSPSTCRDLSNNLFTGPFPEFSTELDSLTLSKNLFSGPLPTSLPPLLTSLAINTNYFTGNLPIFFPLNLTYIDLSDNYFTGIANVFVGKSLFYAFPVKCAALGAALSKNCFSESSKCTAPEAQRNSTMCKAACGTGVWEPLVKGKSQCQGYGTCYPDIPTTTTTVATSQPLSSPTTSTIKRPRLAPGSLPPTWTCACDANAVNVANRDDACTCKQKRSWPCVAPGRVNGGCPKFARCYPYYFSCRGVGCFCLSGYTPTYNARKEVVLCTPKAAAATRTGTRSTSLSAHAASVAERLGSVRGSGMLGLVSGPARMGMEVAGAVSEGVQAVQEEVEEAGARTVRGPARIDLEVEFERAEQAELIADEEEKRGQEQQKKGQRRGGSSGSSSTELLHSLASFIGS
ncbi:unnamed protein product [Closterium sp. NIES-54]